MKKKYFFKLKNFLLNNPGYVIFITYFLSGFLNAWFKSFLVLKCNLKTTTIAIKFFFNLTFFFNFAALSLQALVAKFFTNFFINREKGKVKYLCLFAIRSVIYYVSICYVSLILIVYGYRALFEGKKNILNVWNFGLENPIENTKLIDFLKLTILFYFFSLIKGIYCLFNGIAVYGKKIISYIFQKISGMIIKLLSIIIFIRVLGEENFTLVYGVICYLISHFFFLFSSFYRAYDLIFVYDSKKKEETYSYSGIVNEFYSYNNGEMNENFLRMSIYKFLTIFLYTFPTYFLKFFYNEKVTRSSDNPDPYYLIFLSGTFALADVSHWFQGASYACVPNLQRLLIKKKFKEFKRYILIFPLFVLLMFFPLFSLFIGFFSWIKKNPYGFGIFLKNLYFGLFKGGNTPYEPFSKIIFLMVLQTYLRGLIIFFENISLVKGNFFDSIFKLLLVFIYFFGGGIFPEFLGDLFNLELFLVISNLVYLLIITYRFYKKNYFDLEKN